MGIWIVIAAGLLCLLTAFILTGYGLHAVFNHRRHANQQAATAIVTVNLQNKGVFEVEPGVLLNTLWEHLPNAACQSGECGGCKLRLLEGSVAWIREPIISIDRQTHILACSCEAHGSLRCAIE